MPRGFSEEERETIRRELQETGKQLFSRFGLGKTNVEELTRGAGISKGAFYLFYSSKEELFFDLLEQFEAEVRSSLLSNIALSRAAPREAMKRMLRNVLSIWKRNELFTHFTREEFEHLARKLPPERVQQHFQADNAFAVDFAAAWKERGVVLQHEPRIVAGLIRSLFFVSLHEADFGDDVYLDVVELLIDMVAERLVGS